VKVTRHGKPAKAFTERLRSASEADYERMVNGCLEALICGSKDVLVLFPYTMKFPEDFPRGILEEKHENGSNVHRIKARKLLKWLQDRGHTSITMEDIRGQMISFGLQEAKINDLLQSYG
jgi:hypothetical protein